MAALRLASLPPVDMQTPRSAWGRVIARELENYPGVTVRFERQNGRAQARFSFAGISHLLWQRVIHDTDIFDHDTARDVHMVMRELDAPRKPRERRRPEPQAKTQRPPLKPKARTWGHDGVSPRPFRIRTDAIYIVVVDQETRAELGQFPAGKMPLIEWLRPVVYVVIDPAQCGDGGDALARGLAEGRRA